MIKPPAPPPPVRFDEYRCVCGKLLGRLAPGSQAELGCERCKRAVLIKAS
jgi:phage FluMu protein Com